MIILKFRPVTMFTGMRCSDSIFYNVEVKTSLPIHSNYRFLNSLNHTLRMNFNTGKINV